MQAPIEVPAELEAKQQPDKAEEDTNTSTPTFDHIQERLADAGRRHPKLGHQLQISSEHGTPDHSAKVDAWLKVRKGVEEHEAQARTAGAPAAEEEVEVQTEVTPNGDCKTQQQRDADWHQSEEAKRIEGTKQHIYERLKSSPFSKPAQVQPRGTPLDRSGPSRTQTQHTPKQSERLRRGLTLISSVEENLSDGDWEAKEQDTASLSIALILPSLLMLLAFLCYSHHHNESLVSTRHPLSSVRDGLYAGLQRLVTALRPLCSYAPCQAASLGHVLEKHEVLHRLSALLFWRWHVCLLRPLQCVSFPPSVNEVGPLLLMLGFGTLSFKWLLRRSRLLIAAVSVLLLVELGPTIGTSVSLPGIGDKSMGKVLLDLDGDGTISDSEIHKWVFSNKIPDAAPELLLEVAALSAVVNQWSYMWANETHAGAGPQPEAEARTLFFLGQVRAALNSTEVVIARLQQTKCARWGAPPSHGKGDGPIFNTCE